MTKSSKYKLLSYIVLAVVYLVLTAQILITFNTSFEVSRLGGSIWIYGFFSLIAAFVNSTILFLISNRSAINLGSNRDHKVIKITAYIVILLLMIIWTFILLFVLSNKFGLAMIGDFMQFALTSHFFAGICSSVAIVALLSISIKIPGRKK